MALKTKSLVARDTMKGVVTWYRVLQNQTHLNTSFDIHNDINIECGDTFNVGYVTHFE